MLGHGDVSDKLFVAADAFSAQRASEDRGGRWLRPGARAGDAEPERTPTRSRSRSAPRPTDEHRRRASRSGSRGGAPAEAAAETAADQSEPVTSETDGEPSRPRPRKGAPEASSSRPRARASLSFRRSIPHIRTQPPATESVLGLHRDRDGRAMTWVKRTPTRAGRPPSARRCPHVGRHDALG